MTTRKALDVSVRILRPQGQRFISVSKKVQQLKAEAHGHGRAGMSRRQYVCPLGQPRPRVPVPMACALHRDVVEPSYSVAPAHDPALVVRLLEMLGAL
jgi:hypothetical protein